MSIILFELHSLKVITALFAIITNNICIVFMSMFAVYCIYIKCIMSMFACYSLCLYLNWTVTTSLKFMIAMFAHTVWYQYLNFTCGSLSIFAFYSLTRNVVISDVNTGINFCILVIEPFDVNISILFCWNTWSWCLNCIHWNV